MFLGFQNLFSKFQASLKLISVNILSRSLTMDSIRIYLLKIAWLTCMQNVTPKKCDKMIIYFDYIRMF